METNLYIHIGTHKTGSTALQVFFQINRHLLKENGVLYPGIHENHFPLTKELCDPQIDVLKEGTVTNQVFSEIYTAIGNVHSILLSSESFIAGGRSLICRLVETLKRYNINIPVTVIVYCRPQTEYLESAYRQLVNSKNGRESKTFANFLQPKTLQKSFDYYNLLNNWAIFFGRENIKVIRYAKSISVADYLNIFKNPINIAEGVQLQKPPSSRSNISICATYTEFLRWMNIFGIPDEAFESLKQLTSVIKEYPSLRFLSAEQEESIRLAVQESNRLVAIDYLLNEDGRLFPDTSTPSGSPNIETIQQNCRYTPDLFENTIKTIYSLAPKLLERILIAVIRFNPVNAENYYSKVHFIRQVARFLDKQTLRNLFATYKNTKQDAFSFLRKSQFWSLHYRLEGEAIMNSIISYNPHVVLNILRRDNTLKIVSSGNDPGFTLRQTPFKPEGFSLVFIEFQTFSDTILQAFYQTSDCNEFMEEKSIKKSVQNGWNFICIPIYNKLFNGIIRIDPGMAPGKYIFSSIEIRSGGNSLKSKVSAQVNQQANV
jgi:hypothetical protein